MFDLTRVDARLFDMVTPVVEELASGTGLEAGCILLVGAACRDILHAAFGHDFSARATTDTDIGIAVKDWIVSDLIEERYTRVGSNGIRYRIAGINVDIMPFGEIENPEGISMPASRNEELVVFGYRDVYERALPLTLPNGQTIRIPQPAGYVALKMRACIDRSAYYGQDRDVRDLALAAFWYQNWEEAEDRLYGSEFELLADLDMDFDVAAVRLLGLDAAAQLSQANRAELADRWNAMDPVLLAHDFILPVGASYAPDLARRQAFIAQFGS